MKKTLTTLGMGACVLLAFNSCSSTDGYYGTEEAVPMSEMTVADGEIPPWLLEDDGEYQIDAGATTHNPNTFPIPEPGETMGDEGGSASVNQNQPELAAHDAAVESHEDDIIVAPLDSSNPVISPDASTTATAAVTTPVTPRETAGNGALKSATADARRTNSSRPKQQRKSKKRVTEPTLVSYKVKPGDNLSEIARRSNTTVEAIRKASGIKGDTIYAGSTIKVPFTPNSYKMSQSGKSSTHVVRSGESLSLIAERNGLTTQELLRANNMTAKQGNLIRPGQKLTIPGKGGSSASGSSSAPKTHTVKRGETLSGIAAKYGVTTQALLTANKMSAKQASRIRVGQKLTIPGKATGKKGKKSKKGKKRRS